MQELLYIFKKNINLSNAASHAASVTCRLRFCPPSALVTDGRTDGRRDIPFYKSRGSHLKKKLDFSYAYLYFVISSPFAPPFLPLCLCSMVWISSNVTRRVESPLLIFSRVFSFSILSSRKFLWLFSNRDDWTLDFVFLKSPSSPSFCHASICTHGKS